jgi:hypothetical protein
MLKFIDLQVSRYNTGTEFLYNSEFMKCQSTYDYYRTILEGTEHIPKLEEKADFEFAEELTELISTKIKAKK